TVEVKRSGGGKGSSNPNAGRGGGGGGGMGGGGGRGGGRGGGGGMGGGGGNMGGMGNPGGDRPQQTGASATVRAQWISSMPVKQALARAQYGDEAAENPDAKRSLEKAETQYVILLIGLPRNMVKRGDQMKSMA